MKAEFYINKMIRFEKKEQSDHCRVMVEKKTALEFEVSKTRSNDPLCIWVEHCRSWDRLKFWIKGSPLAIFSGNIWSRLKLPTIKILCCVGSSLINKIKSLMKLAKRPGRYTIHYYQ